MGRPTYKSKFPGSRCIKDRHGQPKYWRVKSLDGGAEISLKAEYGTVEWERQYLAARGGTAPVIRTLPARRAGSAARMEVAEAVERYLRSIPFKNLADVTREHRRYNLNRLAAARPNALLGELTKEKLADLFADMRPFRHRAHVIDVRMLYRFHELPDPTVGYVYPKPVDSKGFRTWKETHVEQYRERHLLGTLERTIFELALGTCQRKSDLIRMHWSDIVDVIGEDGESYRAIHVLSQHKTKATVLIPIDPDLQEALDAYRAVVTARLQHLADNNERRRKGRFDAKWYEAIYGSGDRRRAAAGDIILRNPFTGYAISSKRFSDIMKAACESAGLPTFKKGDATFEGFFSTHGLRKGGMNAIAEAGGNVLMIMATSGHTSTRNVDHYIKDHERQNAAIEALRLRQARKAKQIAGKAKTTSEGRVVQLTPRKPV